MTLDTVSRYIEEHLGDEGFTYFEKDAKDTHFESQKWIPKTIKLTDGFEVLEGVTGHPVLSPDVLLEFAKTTLLMSERNDELRRKLRKYE